MSEETKNPPQIKATYSYDEANQTITVYDSVGVWFIDKKVSRKDIETFIFQHGRLGEDFIFGEIQGYVKNNIWHISDPVAVVTCELEEWLERYVQVKFPRTEKMEEQL